jgi:hypothetical protein
VTWRVQELPKEDKQYLLQHQDRPFLTCASFSPCGSISTGFAISAFGFLTPFSFAAAAAAAAAAFSSSSRFVSSAWMEGKKQHVSADVLEEVAKWSREVEDDDFEVAKIVRMSE